MKDDEYMKDGLVYCKKCNRPRQIELNLWGVAMRPRVLCPCQQAEEEKEKQERKAREMADKIMRNRSEGMREKALQKYTFQNDTIHGPEMKTAENYVKHWEQMRKEGMGLLIWGDVGTGKTYLAGCIANALLDQGVPVMMTNFSRILNTLTGMYQGDRNRYIDDFQRYSLLILDDLGIERNSEFALEQVFGVIDGRYRSRLPMIVTTNLTLTELKHPESLAKARIYDRVLERCVPLRVSGKNLRQQQAGENLKKAKRMLTETV